jgi:hypothetical protein
VRSITELGNCAVVLPDGIVKSTVREPVENRTAGSSLGITLFDVKESVKVPDTGVGCAVDDDKPMLTC